METAFPETRDRVRAVIFDVDGTLYHQPPVRKRMAVRLAGYFLPRPWRWRELLGIYHFRKVREEERFRVSELDTQIREAARRAGIGDTARLRSAIQRWMFQEPLRYIRKYPQREVLDRLRQAQARGKEILIYSDYAPEEKLTALGVKPDAVFYPGRNGIEELKPSEKAMRHILSSRGLAPEEVCYFGDRPEKDGASASMVGIQYIQVQR